MRKRETGLRERVTRKRRKWPWILLTILLLLILSVGAFWLKYGYEISKISLKERIMYIRRIDNEKDN